MKNLKCTLSMIALATTLSLTGCGNHYSNMEVKELDNAIDTLQDENQLLNEEIENFKQNETTENISMNLGEIGEITLDDDKAEISETNQLLTNDELRDLADEINEALSTHFSFTYKNYSSTIEVSRKTWIEDDEYEIPEELYSKINMLLNQTTILELINIDDKFDLSKLNVSNLETLSMNSVKIDLAGLLMNKVSSETKIKYSMLNELNNEGAKKIIEYLIDNNIELETLSLHFENSDVSPEVYKQLQNLNSKYIFFYVNNNMEETNEISNIDIQLNDNTRNFSLIFASDKELGNVIISSNNKGLDIAMDNVLITEDTKFEINNDNFDITLCGNNTSTLPFYDLSSAYNFSYIDDEKSVSYYEKGFLVKVQDKLTGEDLDFYYQTFNDAIYLIEKTKGMTIIK